MGLNISPDVLALNPILQTHKVIQVGHGYKSNLEKRFADEVIPISGVAEWYYEPMSFKLPGGRYTPDFMLILRDPLSFIFCEIKGWSQSYRSSRKAFREAATTHTWATWLWYTWNKDEGWRFEEMKGGND